MAKDHGGDTSKLASVRHGRLRRSSGWRNVARVGLTSLIVVALSGLATVAYAIWQITPNQTVDMPVGPEVEAGATAIDGAFSILLVGSDTREGQQNANDGEEGELNDVTMLLYVSEDHQNATVVSFPRDLMVPIPSCPGPNGEENYTSAMAEQQINVTLGVGGLPCVAATVSELSGLEVPYAGLITFDGVVAITNAIGGVEVCLTEPIVDPNTDLNLPAGMNTLQGWSALQFLRTRHGVGDGGDTSRISNQQVYLSALARQLQSSETLTNPAKVYSLAKAGLENTTLSSNMANIEFMRAIAGVVQGIDLQNINFVQYPSYSHPTLSGRLMPDYESAAVLFDVIESGQPFEVTATGEGVASGEGDDAAETTETAVPEETATPETETADPSGPVQLPSEITGQAAIEETCSQGRTVY